GDGHLSFRPLPRLAQVSAAFGLVFGDWDADGRVDLAMAQNFYSPQPETGNLDGGLGMVLKGLGDGSFETLRIDQSGFLLPGDAKALAQTDLNGDARPDLVATVNSSIPRIFINQVSTGRWLVVRLKGREGNLRGIGSRVSLKLKSGRTLLGEVHSGSSYLTGSSTDLFFAVPAGDQAVAVTIRSPLGNMIEKELTSSTGVVAISLP
ncbi:MAG: VCBS repeat-containing protein, partial [Opitutales bacterium]